MEPVRSAVRRRDPTQADRSAGRLTAMAMACRRGLWEDQWRASLPAACRGPRGRGSARLRLQSPGAQGSIEIPQEIDETARHARGHRQRSTGFRRRGAEGARRSRPAENRSMAEQQGGKLAPAVPRTRTRHAPHQTSAEPSEVRRCACLHVQSLQSGTTPLQPEQFQTEPSYRSRRVAPAEHGLKSSMPVSMRDFSLLL
jgi:hypothetical protein